MHYIFFILSLTLFSISSWAQEEVVQGQVVDASTGEKLPYVNIYVGEGKGTLSNEEGYFSIKVSANDVVQLSCVGYEKTTIKVKEMSAIIKLKPYTTMMKEVTVKAESIDKILKRTIKKLQHDYSRCDKWTRKYFFRTYSETKEGCYIAEAFIQARSVVNLRSVGILNGIEGGCSGGGGNTLNLWNSNIHRLIEVAPMIYASNSWKHSITPMGNHSRSQMFNDKSKNPQLDWHVCYNTRAQNIQGADGKTIYKIEFTWKRNNPIYEIENLIWITGTAYVEAETYRLLRFDGLVNNCMLYTGEPVSIPVDIDFHLEYDYSKGIASVSHMAIKGGNPLTNCHVILFAIEPDVKKTGNLKMSHDNMVTAIKQAGYDSSLWEKYDIVRRTKEEERIAFGTKE